jgi:hypothetical protein
MPKKNVAVLVAATDEKMKEKILYHSKKHKGFGVILFGIVGLNLLYGFDLRFTFINILWILINIV